MPDVAAVVPSAASALIDLMPDNTLPAVETGLAWWPVFAVIMMMLMVNVAANKAIPSLYLFWALGGSTVVLTIGLLDGTTWRDLGLAPSTWLSGLVWGMGVIVLIYAIYEIASRLRRTRNAFADQNIAGMPRWKVYWRALVELPFGTVLFEEIAFRGVLWAMLSRRVGWVDATWMTAVLFGLWHILPSLDLHLRNPGLANHHNHRIAQAKAVLGSVITTALGALMFTALRIVSGSLFAPMGLHWATNGWGYLFARRVAANDRGKGSAGTSP